MTPESTSQGIRHLWPESKPLIGMVHLLPLPGSPSWAGSMDAVMDRALADATALTRAGLDGVLVENYGDVPFHAGSVPAETVAAMSAVVARVVDAVSAPVGVNVLRNDARAALGIAAATGARFIRVNVHTGVMWTDQGVIEGRAAETLRARRSLGADVAILADVDVKHATAPPGLAPEDAAADAWHRGLADGLVVSGVATGAPTDPGLAKRVGAAVPDATVHGPDHGWAGRHRHRCGPGSRTGFRREGPSLLRLEARHLGQVRTVLSADDNPCLQPCGLRACPQEVRVGVEHGKRLAALSAVGDLELDLADVATVVGLFGLPLVPHIGGVDEDQAAGSQSRRRRQKQLRQRLARAHQGCAVHEDQHGVPALL